MPRRRSAKRQPVRRTSKRRSARRSARRSWWANLQSVPAWRPWAFGVVKSRNYARDPDMDLRNLELAELAEMGYTTNPDEALEALLRAEKVANVYGEKRDLTAPQAPKKKRWPWAFGYPMARRPPLKSNWPKLVSERAERNAMTAARRRKEQGNNPWWRGGRNNVSYA